MTSCAPTSLQTPGLKYGVTQPPILAQKMDSAEVMGGGAAPTPTQSAAPRATSAAPLGLPAT